MDVMLQSRASNGMEIFNRAGQYVVQAVYTATKWCNRSQVVDKSSPALCCHDKTDLNETVAMATRLLAI